jgi:hypothetical protein
MATFERRGRAVSILLSFLIAATLSAAAQAQQVQRIEIRDVGIYDVENRGTVDAPGVPIVHHRNISGETKLVRRSNIVPATIGTHFGFRYSIVGNPNGAAVNLRMVGQYPSGGAHDQTTGQTLKGWEFVSPAILGAESYYDYALEQDWELIPGNWTLEIWQGNRKLAEQSFTVVKP